MLVTAHQPQYLPWYGFMQKIAAADLYVCADADPYSHRNWQNRNRIKTKTGLQWLTVPVIHPGKIVPISDIRIEDRHNWREKHFKSLVGSYSKAKYFNKYIPFFESTYRMEWAALAALDIWTMEYIFCALGITTPIVLSSSLNIKKDNPTDQIIAELTKLGADGYISGPMGKDYLAEERFAEAGIDLYYFEAKVPEYPQLWGDFTPFPSVVDYLFNCGGDNPHAFTDVDSLRKECLRLWTV